MKTIKLGVVAVNEMQFYLFIIYEVTLRDDITLYFN